MTSTTMGNGVSCDNRGAFIGTIPLLKQRIDENGRRVWAARAAPELNAALSDHYGIPVDMTKKLDGLSDVADSLNRGDMFHAQLGTLDMKLPDAPPPGRLASGRHIANLAIRLHDSGMLNRAAAANSDDMNSPTPSARAQYQFPITPAQAIPLDLLDLPWARPFEMPAPRATPMPAPGEVAPMPLEFPGYRATRKPVGNPFPDDAECCKEWAEAKEACIDLWEARELGEGSNFGTRYEDCLMAMVTERCGGNEVKDAPKKVPPVRA